jgi:UDP-N-acetylglucosamine 1-carboxyvinyltransferase
MKIQFKIPVRDWLEKNRWTPKTLAEVLGVSRQTIHHWIDGKSVPKNEGIIFTLLTLSTNELIEFDDQTGVPKKFRTLMKQQVQNQYFEVEGGHSLNGSVQIPGAKNAALPMLCAALLTNQKCTFHNVPEISDIEHLLDIFETLGVEVSRDFDKKIVEIQAKNLDPTKLKDCAEARKFRASILIVGPLLARTGQAHILRPGGCIIGARPNDIHLNGFETFGAQVKESATGIELKFEKNKFEHHQLLLPEASVTATENLATFAAGVADQSEILFGAAETHVQGLLRMLQDMGAEIKGIGTHELKITGKKWTELKGGDFVIPSDGILVGTYAIASVLTRGDVMIHNVNHRELYSFYGALKRTGAQFELLDNALHVTGTPKLTAIPKIQTAIYPGFSTDLQSPFGLLLTQCEGKSMVFETLFENRLTYLSELEKMGAKVEIMNAHQARITGVTPLRAANVQSWDLRAGAAMVLAGLIAEGKTKITNIDYIDRGYEHFDTNLKALGAKISRKS